MQTEGSFCANKSPPLFLVTSQIETNRAQSSLVFIKIHFNIILHCVCVCVCVFLLTLSIKIFCSIFFSPLISTCSANLIYTYDSTANYGSEGNNIIIVWHPDLHQSVGHTSALSSRRPCIYICTHWPATLTGVFIGFLSPSRLVA